MDFFSNIGNFLGNAAKNIGSFFTGGGGAADISSFSQANAPINPPVLSGPASFATPQQMQEILNPPTPQGPASFGPADVVSQVRPLLTQFQGPLNLAPFSPTFNASFSGASQTPEEKSQTEAQRRAELQGKTGLPGVSSSQNLSTFTPQQGPSGLGGTFASGTPLGQSTFAASGIGSDNLNQIEEQKNRQNKQPNFQILDLSTAQNAIRSGQLFGAGQSGVYRDSQGNFYGISNAQIANRFGAPDASGRISVTPTVPEPKLAPFETSLGTQPISAEALLRETKTSGVLPTPDKFVKDLQSNIDAAIASQPPIPNQPVVNDPTQEAARNSSNDPTGFDRYLDRERLTLGIPNLQSDYLKAKQAYDAAIDEVQKGIQKIQDDPDLPQGLVNRMIDEFARHGNTFANALFRKVEDAKFLLDNANDELNTRLGIKKFNIQESDKLRKEQEGLREKQIADQRAQIGEYISSKAIGNFSDDQLQQIANSGLGYTFENLKSMREAVKSNNETKINQAQEKIDIALERLRLAEEKAGGGGFTKTQINKGAADANMPVSEFNKLDEESKNYFINNKSDIRAAKKKIDNNEEDNNTYPSGVESFLQKYADSKKKKSSEGFFSKADASLSSAASGVGSFLGKLFGIQ